MSRPAKPTPPEWAAAAGIFDLFAAAGTMKTILGCYRQLCHTLMLRPNKLPDFYPILKERLMNSWKAQALFKKFDARSSHKVYGHGRACAANKVLVIGAGPCGLRAAIECQLLGAKVVVIEKRDRLSRNNVLHLWPFVIQDLRALGAKKFFGKFCAGSIDHISIRQLQCILLKVALLLGVEFHEGISFEELLEPTITKNSEALGWRALISPPDHPVSQYEFDVLISADGKRNTLQGFSRNEFRGKLAMAITANFINRHSEQEASVPEISGVAFIFNQKFFKDLDAETGIDLENIVYYKDDTHYFVMTAKKHSLLDKGVLLKDYAEVSRLLKAENVDREALMRYAQEAARFSTGGRLPLKDFALNHYGEPDVALFDFTSMYAAENASLVRERLGRRVLCQLVGDTLLEPFWPTGSGCARGFLSALDAAWAIRAWGQPVHPLHVIAERESIYRLLAQTTPENLHRDFGAYTLDPGTRYPNLNRTAVDPRRVTNLYDSDEALPLEAVPTPRKRRREGEVSAEALLHWVGCEEPGLRAAADADALAAAVRRYRPDLMPPDAPSSTVYHVLHQHMGIPPFSNSCDPLEVSEPRLRSYLSRVYNAFKGEVPHVHHHPDAFDQIKQSLLKEQPVRTPLDQSIAAYSKAAEAEKSQHSNRKKRRAVRAPTKVSSDPAEYIRRRIGRLELGDITQLARLLDGHDALVVDEDQDQEHVDRQRELQEQILALLDPDEAPDPKLLRESMAQLLQGNVKTTVQHQDNLTDFFSGSHEKKSAKPHRKLKGLDISTIKVPDFLDIFGESDTEPTLVVERRRTHSPKKDIALSLTASSPKKKEIIRMSSLDETKKEAVKDRRLSEVTDLYKRRHSQSPDVKKRSGSVDVLDTTANTRRIAQLFENKRSQTPSPDAPRAAINPQMALRMQRMADMIGGKRRGTPSPERTERSQSIGSSETAVRRQRMMELIEGAKPRAVEAERAPRRGSGEGSFMMQRAWDMMARHAEGGRRSRGGRRRAARELTKQRFEKSLQMLAAGPRAPESATGTPHDYDLQQYRADAPHFSDRVKKLEQQLQHYEEAHAVGTGGRGSRASGREGRSSGGRPRTSDGGRSGATRVRVTSRSGDELLDVDVKYSAEDGTAEGSTAGVRTKRTSARVAQLAAELAGTSKDGAKPQAQAQKPRDLMRSVGKIEQDDWNVKEIERKIRENRLGRPEPRAAEKVPKWDREQFLGRQRRLKNGDEGEEKWMEIDQTIRILDQKRRDSGRPDQGTSKVANLATKFVKKEEAEPVAKSVPKEEPKKWQGEAVGVLCAVCNGRVFAAERVDADGLQLHRACFRCMHCKAPLRPGNYTMERFGTRLVCLRHSGAGVAAAARPPSLPIPKVTPKPTPERISLELSDASHGAREIDEDEWTDRNFLASETSAAGLSESSSDEYTDAADNAGAVPPAPAHELSPPRAALYFSDDSFGYDDYSDDGAESSGNESCSRMREALEARRREVPADTRPPTDSSEVESEEESESSDESVSSATEVSTDSEFAREEGPPPPPAILVTAPAAPPPAPPQRPAPPTPSPAPLARTRSAGGLATKRALELKRKYLLGEPSPPAVRKSDSTSQIDSKLEAFRSNITEFQKMLHPAPTPVTPLPPRSVLAFNISTEEKPEPMPDIIKNLYGDAPVDLLTKGDLPLCKKDWLDDPISEKKEPEPEPVPEPEPEMDTDSLSSEDSSHTETGREQPVPRVEVHDEGGELIQLDSLMLVEETPPPDAAPAEPAEAPVAMESSSSESGHDGTTLLLTETELSDWAAEGAMDCGLEEDRRRAPRALGRPKPVPAAAHVCGRRSPRRVPSEPTSDQDTAPSSFANFDDFEYADAGSPDPALEAPPSPANRGYMRLVHHYDYYEPGNDRSMDFIERSCSDTVIGPLPVLNLLDNDQTASTTASFSPKVLQDEQSELKSPQVLKSIELDTSEKIVETVNVPVAILMETETLPDRPSPPTVSPPAMSPTAFSPMPAPSPPVSPPCVSPPRASPPPDSPSPVSPPPVSSPLASPPPVSPQPDRLPSEPSTADISPPLVPDTPIMNKIFVGSDVSSKWSSPASMRLYSPAICRSASETFHRATSPTRSFELSVSNLSSGSVSPVSPAPPRDCSDKVQELKREREEQTEVVRRLVLERLGATGRPARRSARKSRVSPASTAPPPVPPPPSLPPEPPAPPPPPRPAPPLMSLPVTPSFSDPELARERRSKSIMKSISNYLNRRLGPRHKWASEPAVSTHENPRAAAHKSTGALQEAPPVPPPPTGYCPPVERRHNHARLPGPSCVGAGDEDERDAMQLWFEARWARLVAQRRAREEAREGPSARRLARLERRLSRPLSAEQQAATVAELVQVSAQRGAHQALMAADRRRSATGSGVCD